MKQYFEMVYVTELVTSMIYDKAMNISIWLSNEGKAYLVQNNTSLASQRRASINSNGSIASKTVTSPSMPTYEKQLAWVGVCFHNNNGDGKEGFHKATSVSVNSKFSLIAVGTDKGIVYVYSAQNYSSVPVLSHKLVLTSWSAQSTQGSANNSVESLEWTSDGYAISVGFRKRGLAVWSVYGGLLCSSSEMDDVFDGEK